LQKRLAAAGLGSRREIERWIAAGRVTLNGQVAKLGDRAAASDSVLLDGKPVAQPRAAATRVLLYHKPVGELVTRSDPEGRPTVFARLPPGRWIAVRRLDINRSGLLLLTESGELANQLMHPRYGLEREYVARVKGELSAAELARLREGILLDGVPASFERIESDRPGEGVNRWYRVVLREGRNREVRRLFEALGHPVSRLSRVRYGPLELPADLAPGKWRELVDTAKISKL
jgi:23S rRNA pseudouridine2605 synthase